MHNAGGSSLGSSRIREPTTDSLGQRLISHFALTTWGYTVVCESSIRLEVNHPNGAVRLFRVYLNRAEKADLVPRSQIIRTELGMRILS